MSKIVILKRFVSKGVREYPFFDETEWTEANHFYNRKIEDVDVYLSKNGGKLEIKKGEKEVDIINLKVWGDVDIDTDYSFYFIHQKDKSRNNISEIIKKGNYQFFDGGNGFPYEFIGFGQALELNLEKLDNLISESFRISSLDKSNSDKIQNLFNKVIEVLEEGKSN